MMMLLFLIQYRLCPSSSHYSMVRVKKKLKRAQSGAGDTTMVVLFQ